MTKQHPTATVTDELAPFAASFDDSTMEKLDEHAGSSKIGRARRLSLAVCARDSEILAKVYNETPDLFETMFDSVEAFHEHAKGLAEMAEAAYLRLLLVGQNPPTTNYQYKGVPNTATQTEARFTPVDIRMVGDDGLSHVHRFEVRVPPNTAPEDIPQAVTGWRYVTDDEGEALPFTPDNLALMLENYPHAAPAIAKASMILPSA